MKRQLDNKYSRKAPIGIKVISILNYIFSVFGILFGIFALIGGIVFVIKGDSFVTQFFKISSSGIIESLSEFYSWFGFVVILLGILSLVVAIILILSGFGLWKGKKWARISEIILVLLCVILWSIELFRGSLLNFIVVIPSLIILFYLIFSKNVKNLFS